jgi:hypothetical protein
MVYALFVFPLKKVRGHYLFSKPFTHTIRESYGTIPKSFIVP